MALAFRRATKEADDAATYYDSHFTGYYGFPTDGKPLAFDWDSAKAIEGESKHNANDEVLPKCVTIAKAIKNHSNYLTGMVSGIASRADKLKDLAFELQRKQVKSILVHFDEKSTKDGECTWTCEVKDQVLHATMHWTFKQYCGRENYEDVGEFLWAYLDEKENLSFELEKAKVSAVESNYTYFYSDSVGYMKSALPSKEIAITVNYDEIRGTPGTSIVTADKPERPNNFVLLRFLNDGRGMYFVFGDTLARILKDDMGKEAFADAFDEVHIAAKAAPKHAAAVSKSGKKLIFTLEVKMDDHYGATRGYDAAALAKKVEELL